MCACVCLCIEQLAVPIVFLASLTSDFLLFTCTTPLPGAGAIPDVQAPGAGCDLLWDIIMAIVTYIHVLV